MFGALLMTISAAAPAHAAKPAKRVVALEWEYVEDLLATGVRPVGAADLKGMKEWTAVSAPSGITDVGIRQEPSLERIAALKPDLIVATRFRTTRNLRQLKKIAPVLRLDAYPRGGKDAQYKAMLTGIRKIAARTGKRSRADAVIRDLDRTYATLRKDLRKAGRDGSRVAIASGGGTIGSPAVRMFTGNSLTAGVLRRLGLRNGWPTAKSPFGFSTVGLEGLVRVKPGWLVFAYPSRYASVVREWQSQSTWKSLDVVKQNRVRTIPGNTWPYGGPLSTKILAQRLAGALTR